MLPEPHDEQVLENLTKGQALTIKHAAAEMKQTEAPKLHTEATLLYAMEYAGAQLENGCVRKTAGIGEPSTYADIIKGLFELGYIAYRRIKKVDYIEPTKLGVRYLRGCKRNRIG